MAVLQFDGTDDKLLWSTLAAALANASDGALTMAMVFKRNTTGTWQTLTSLETAAALEATFELSGTGDANNNKGVYTEEVQGDFFVSALTSTASPYLTVVSKGAGSVLPRLGWKLGSGGAWTHEDCASAVADQAAATKLQIGAVAATPTDFFNGWIGVIGIWEGAMSDANKEALDDNWQTSDWWNSAHGEPVFLAELNVAGASVVDLAGNASSLSATGTTLDGAETLDSWNFDGTGFDVATTAAIQYPTQGPMLIRYRMVPYGETGHHDA